MGVNGTKLAAFFDDCNESYIAGSAMVGCDWLLVVMLFPHFSSAVNSYGAGLSRILVIVLSPLGSV
jgi:hypothetical protein